jgi:hypothetical protein
MKILVLLGFITISLACSAEVIRSHIHSYEPEHNLIKLTNGRVVFTNGSEKSMWLDGVQSEVEILTDDDNNLISIVELEIEARFKNISLVEENPVTYEPTILPSVDEAKKIFERLNWRYQRLSQCFNRAHIWSHDEFTKNQVKSLKGWIFFTSSYINRHRFIWWFHVAPMVRVKSGTKAQDYILDHRYGHGPQTIDEWKNMMVYTNRSCKTDGKFVDYDTRADQTQDCYWFTTPMHYWQPRDIQVQELENRIKSQFLAGELKSAYSEAF